MKAISIDRTNTDGFETIHIANGELAFAFIPALGGKISSLRDLRTGREWLWKSSTIPYQRVPHGTSYLTHGDTGGWDECFPSVSPCEYPSAPWTGAAIQDHGELWSQQVEYELDETAESVMLSTHWQGVALPYQFDRTIRITADAPGLEFDYRLTNVGDAPVEWIWSAHPLIAIEPGMEVRVPPTARFHVGFVYPEAGVAQRNNLSFPPTVNGIELGKLPDPSAKVAIKLWSDPLTEGWASVRAADGELRMRWDVSRLPQLGVWLNLAAWTLADGTPYYNMGLEPCIGAQDSLADAITTYRLFEALPPNHSRTWSLEVEMGRTVPEQ